MWFGLTAATSDVVGWANANRAAIPAKKRERGADPMAIPVLLALQEFAGRAES